MGTGYGIWEVPPTQNTHGTDYGLAGNLKSRADLDGNALTSVYAVHKKGMRFL
jgi:hypothetical protein